MQSSRREVLRVGLSGLAVVSLGSTVPAFLSRMALAEQMPTTQMSRDNILVVVQMSGGNDGLNTVIPFTNDEYYKARPVIGIKDQKLKLNDQFMLNPAMIGFKDLYDQGQLAIINGCGYPSPSRSHFRSMEIWQTAAPEKQETLGWLGHYIDHALRGSQSMLKAVNIGQELPRALVADGMPVPSIQSINDFSFKLDKNSQFDAKMEDQIIRECNAVRNDSPALEYLSRQATNAIIETDNIRKVASNYKSEVRYPKGLGEQLRTIAQLINGNFGTRVFYVQCGGFDTHGNQFGGHGQVLANVTNAIAAFQNDLAEKGLTDKVTTMCFSEFGRRVQQNGSNGTDHGAAGPMFMIGGKVKGGIHADYPSLTDLDGGDLKYTVDFRKVYATILDKWLAADSNAVLGGKFGAIDVL
ncbi:MAG: DUF1501 domain-containing protein [Planctomycetes bacterium]|nr:DUF1501 domain-containing protein [Planctomycetota bacterium]